MGFVYLPTNSLVNLRDFLVYQSLLTLSQVYAFSKSMTGS